MISSTNIDIWPSYGQIWVCVFWPIGLKFLEVTIYIHQLVIGNHDFDAFLNNYTFWRENGHGRHASAQVSEALRPDQKVGPLDGLFWSTVKFNAVRPRFYMP